MEDIQRLLQMISCEMASEAYFVSETSTGSDGETQYYNPGQQYTDALVSAKLEAGNGGALSFPQQCANEFTGNYTVVAQHFDNNFGFSGTLLRDRETNELILSLRSTEFHNDLIRDGLADIEIFNKGYAFGQIASMEVFYQDLIANVDGMCSNTKLTVTGYSLGGHLATAFEELHPDIVNKVYTFNGAGVGHISNPEMTLETLITPFVDLIEADPELGYTSPSYILQLAAASLFTVGAGTNDVIDAISGR